MKRRASQFAIARARSATEQAYKSPVADVVFLSNII